MFSGVFSVIRFAIKCIKLFYRLTNATGLSILLVVTAIVIALCRYFRLKQPTEVPQQIIDAFCGGNETMQHSCNNDTVEPIGWWPIANRGACLDSLENSRSAIEKVGKTN